MYKQFFRKLLFLLPPETIHELVVMWLKLPFFTSILRPFFNFEHPALEREVFGLKFKNPVGLAAGFDKNAEVFVQLKNFGFGFIEIGTVTPQPQPGNPKPRIFRLPADEALINRMGFNNDGVEAVARRLEKKPKDLIIGGNIGKNKETPNEKAVKDYEICFRTLFDYVDFFVVNVSSPNTPNLRDLQARAPLMQILSHLQNLNLQYSKRKPILLKIAPDLSYGQINEIIQIVQETGIDGLIATNTTIGRDGLCSPMDTIFKIGSGGLSGKPLKKRATDVIRYIHQQSNGSIPIIGVGGIHSPEDALEKFEAGASLVEIYTGFIYEGPTLVKRINKVLIKQTRINN